MDDQQKTQSNQPVHCPHCGAKNLMSFQFCQSCGKALPWNPATQPQLVNQANVPTAAIPQSPKKKQTSSCQMLGCIGCGTFALMSLLMGLMNAPTPTPQIADTDNPPKPTPRPTAETTNHKQWRLALEAQQKREADKKAYNEANPLELLKWKFQSEEYSRYIVGSIRNNTDETLSYAEIRIGLYDSSGNQVGSTMTNVNGLEAGKTWKFKALVFEDSATDAKVIGLEGH